jgi:precorrin-6Y C5,15-methyltransferase (decarboxylating)
MTPVHVVGIGLDGADGLSNEVCALISQSTLLMGSDRHLSYFPNHPARQPISDFQKAMQTIRQTLIAPSSADSHPLIVVLASGDPLFYGIGRLLLEEFDRNSLTFHPHISAIQLAFSRIKLPWQDACIISAHGRSIDSLIQALKQGHEKIAILTDPIHSPRAIAQLVQGLNLPYSYRLWVCENLGGTGETVRSFATHELDNEFFATLNVVVLVRVNESEAEWLNPMPLFGIPDAAFVSFADRPGLMTKREVRLLILGELSLQQQHTLWDIGAGTGSVSVEVGRISPKSSIYAIEKTAAGITLIKKNIQRFKTPQVIPVQGMAPEALADLPDPDRIFIGGSGGHLLPILAACQQRLQPHGVIVMALATLEHLATVITWLKTEAQHHRHWRDRLLHVQISQSVSVGTLTRWSPQNPVMLITLEHQPTGDRHDAH